MSNYKRKSIKIKRGKNHLYKKRKSTGRKIAEVILLILLAGGLIFVGYSIAKGLSNSIGGGNATDSTPQGWTPPESSSSDTTPQQSGSESTEEITPPPTTAPEPETSGGSYVVPETALNSASALTQALSSAKNAGFTQVIIPVKNDMGELLYATTIDNLKNTNLVKGTLPAGQIASMAKGMGLEAKALLPALRDHLTPASVLDTGYWFKDDSYAWLDNYADRGGRRWIDPFRKGSSDYLSSVAKELTDAGFDEVLLSQMRFPVFKPYDQSILDGKYFTATRYTALTALYNNVNSADGGKTAAVINMSDLLAGYGKSYGDTAEMLSDSAFDGKVYLNITLSEFGNKLKISDKETIDLPADPAQKAKALMSKAEEYLGTKYTIVPVIAPENMNWEQVAKCYEVLDS